ncbi:MAG: bifunctional isocitrate dehydrogenase kinase/phosphatase [Candidatus Pelagadaptatus aseana]|uniref:bifunctional isocitrate dehydrogenase kinase/phosphatase n=1 Tax=Candidatus Pelagadaptatus aseana TaxID=3120508 RepID=UPI0039B15F9B
MNSNIIPAARRIAKTILNGFEAYFADFQNLTLGAKTRFEQGNWQAVQQSHFNRIELYKSKVNQVMDLVGSVTSKDVNNLELWKMARLAYSQLVCDHSNYEIAETFFNSVFCAQFSHQHIHDSHLFVKPSRSLDDKPLKRYSIYMSYDINHSLPEVLNVMLDDFEFSVPWEDKERDVANLCACMKPYCQSEKLKQVHIDILESVFYRNKCAYLVGRIRHHNGLIPIVIPVLNNEKGGLYIDTVILDQDSASIIFSFTRSYFMVDAPIPSRLVRFLNTLMPNKELTELYTAIGFNKHGKTEFYRHIIEHMKRSDDQFVIAPGIKGMVMSVFTLPSYDVVFKVIKDKFDYPKQVTEKIVKEKYKLVSRSERAGRMADTQEYKNFIFYRNRFSSELLDELMKVAPSKIILTDKWVIIRHLYTERRMIPLNLYLQTADDEAIYDVMDEYGNAIKQLADANIFPGDMLLKNFGVTRHGRVVFYDYDEIVLITECNFRKIPEPRTEAEEMADRPWYTVAENDIFPEEFRLFFSGNPKAKKAFEEQHSDLYDYHYWQGIQDSIERGVIRNTFAYRKKIRFNRP